MSDATPKPGWYSDPENPAAERWWNGVGWSEQQRPSTVADAASTPPATVAPATPATPVAPDSTGFVFGTTATTARPDPYAPPPPTQPYYGAAYGARPASATNGLALAGLLVSCFAWMFVTVVGPIVGIVLSIAGLAQAPRREQQGLPSGRGLAIAGIIVGAVVLVFMALAFLALLTVTTSSTFR